MYYALIQNYDSQNSTQTSTLSIWDFNVRGSETSTAIWFNPKKEDPLVKDIREFKKAMLKALAKMHEVDIYSLPTHLPIPLEAKREIRRGYSQAPRLPGYRSTRNR